MDITALYSGLRAEGLAARRYQREGRGKFRDCLTLGRNGRLLFERFNYGEAAGLVFSMWGNAAEDGALRWEKEGVGYSGKDEAPALLTGMDGAALELDGGRLKWQPAAALKSWPAGGLGRLAMLLGR